MLQDAKFAAKSMLSFEQLGSQNNWPASHQNPAWKETLQHLSEENTYLKQQLAARADTKFAKGILQHSVKDVQIVHVGPSTDQTELCITLETERVHLKQEIYQLRTLLNERYPGAMTVPFFENQLAAETRLRECQTIQHDSVHDKMDRQAKQMRQLGDIVSGLAEQNLALCNSFGDKPPATDKVISKHPHGLGSSFAQTFC